MHRLVRELTAFVIMTAVIAEGKPALAAEPGSRGCVSFLSGIDAENSNSTFTGLLQKMAELGWLTAGDLESIAQWPEPRNPFEALEIPVDENNLQKARAFKQAFEKLLVIHRSDEPLDWKTVSSSVKAFARMKSEAEESRGTVSNETKPLFFPVLRNLPPELAAQKNYDDNSIELAHDGYPIFYIEGKKGTLIDGKTMKGFATGTEHGSVYTRLDTRSPNKVVLLRDGKNIKIYSAADGEKLFSRPIKGLFPEADAKLEKGQDYRNVEIYGPFKDGKGHYQILLRHEGAVVLISSGTKEIKRLKNAPNIADIIGTLDGRVLIVGLNEKAKKIQVVDITAEKPETVFETEWIKKKYPRELALWLHETSQGRIFLYFSKNENTGDRNPNYLVDIATGRTIKVPPHLHQIENMPATTIIEDPSGRLYFVVEQVQSDKRETVKLLIHDLETGRRVRSQTVPITYLDYEKQFLRLRDGRTLFFAGGERGKDPTLDNPKDKVYVYDFFNNESHLINLGPLHVKWFTIFHETEDGRIDMYYRNDDVPYELERSRLQIYGPVDD
jgi:hypothetical protein